MRNRSFTKAARLLYITQSAVSHAVQELETEAGTLLLTVPPKRSGLRKRETSFCRKFFPSWIPARQ
ncbi:MAG: LysR family transcriptional regulator [Eisenbergiella sp.]